MWLPSAELRHVLAALALLALAACGDGEHDSGDDEILLHGNGGTLGLDVTASVSVQGAELGEDVVIAWTELSVDLLGLPVAEPDELRLWAFSDLSREQIAAGVVADTLESSSVLTLYACQPHERACAFSDLEVYGHDYDVRDDFGVLDATWLLTLHGAGRRGVQSLGFIEPGSGDVVTIDDGTAGLSLGVSGGQPISVAAGSDPELDWSGLDTDAQGGTLASYRLDLLGLFHLPVGPGELENSLQAHGLSGAPAWWLEVPDRDRARLSELQGDEPFDGVDGEGTWLLGLYESSSIRPLPRVLLVLQSR